jgi:CRISPR-associated endonuclease/helicase Cas3
METQNNIKTKAHVKKNSDGSWSEPQYLDEHLKKTSELAGCFAKAFNSEAWGRAAGLCHDIGKSTSEWQEYICTSSGMIDEETHDTITRRKIDHSSSSAKLAEVYFGTARGRILSYCIAGHHAGLPDYREHKVLFCLESKILL